MFLVLSGHPLNLYTVIKAAYPSMSIAAEFKKASPSKGPINIDADPVVQCMQYADAGVSVISVLTEFKHFKGTIMIYNTNEGKSLIIRTANISIFTVQITRVFSVI
jgi:indole-3-glycerol phosphate synthase